jgi:Uma2 family endonuclease
METTLAIPATLAERLQMGPDEQRIPGSYEDFVAWLERCDYPIEYENGNIILMSIASDEHEQIVANLIYALVGQLIGKPEYKRYGSNRHIFIESLAKAYSPDASVVKGTPQPFTYAPGKEAYTNPWLVAEVVSPSSRNRDFGEKLQGYKAIPSLQYLLYIEQGRPFVTLFERIPGTARWRSTDYDALDQSLPLGDFALEMRDVYENLGF